MSKQTISKTISKANQKQGVRHALNQTIARGASHNIAKVAVGVQGDGVILRALLLVYTLDRTRGIYSKRGSPQYR